MSGNIIIELWKIQWIGAIDLPGQPVKISFKNGAIERLVNATFTKRELIIKQSVIIPFPGDKSNVKVFIDVGDLSCYGDLPVADYSSKLGSSAMKLTLQDSKNTSIARLYADIQVILNGNSHPPAIQTPPTPPTHFSLDSLTLYITSKTITSLKVSMFDCRVSTQSPQSSQQIILQTNEPYYKKVALPKLQGEESQKVEFNLNSRKLGTRVLLSGGTVVGREADIEIQLVDQSGEKVGGIRGNVIAHNEKDKQKGLLFLHSPLLTLKKELKGKHRFKMALGKQNRFCFVDVKPGKGLWVQTCIFKKIEAQNELRFELLTPKDQRIASGFLYVEDYLDGSRYCNKIIQLMTQGHPIGQVRVDVQYEQQKCIFPPIK